MLINAKHTKNVKRTYLRYLAVPDAILGGLFAVGDESSDGFPINEYDEDVSTARQTRNQSNEGKNTNNRHRVQDRLEKQ